MEKEAVELFLKNYKNEGLCEGLDKCIKSFSKGYKNNPKTISYLPWAIAERIFRLQGGKIDVVDWKYSVDFDTVEESMNLETGELEKKEKVEKALFIHLKGTWMGEELEEYYPIFDNQTSRVIQAPDAQQLNTSRQRGSVRLIARLSGIGLWVFEQQDQQFEEDKDTNTQVKVNVVEEPKKEKTVKHKKQETVEEQQTKEKIIPTEIVDIPHEEEKEEELEDNFNIMAQFFGQEVEEKQTMTTPKVEIAEDFADGSEEKSDLLLKIKGKVKTHRQEIMDFRDSKGKSTLADLSYNEMKELLEEIGD